MEKFRGSGFAGDRPKIFGIPVRLGYMPDTSWDSITIEKDLVSIKLGSKHFAFHKADIIAIVITGGWSLRILHTKTDYPKQIFFYPYSLKRIKTSLENYGFPVKSELNPADMARIDSLEYSETEVQNNIWRYVLFIVGMAILAFFTRD